MTLKEIAVLTAPDVCVMPSHNHLYLERLAMALAENPLAKRGFIVEIENRAIQLAKQEDGR